MRLVSKKIIFIFPIILISYFIFLKIAFNEIYTSIIKEDNLLETAEVVIYFISFLFAISISINFFRKKYNLYGILYLALSFGLILICGEEISWGQRIFKIVIPEYFKVHNVQEELTLHNLDFLHNPTYGLYVLLGFYGTFAWLLVSGKIKNKYNSFVKYFVPDWYLVFFFLPVFIIFSYYCLYGASIILFARCPFGVENGSFIVWRDQEPAEFLLSLGFLFFLSCIKNGYSIE